MTLDPIDVLARQLVRHEPAADRAALMRAELVQAAGAGARPHRRVLALSVAIAAVAVCALVALRFAHHEVTRYRGQILASDGAAYVRSGTPGQETVTIADGVMRFEVTPLAAGEHFHVVVGTHHIEVRGTVFHVVARHGELVSVAVARGRVDVIGPDHAVTHLAVGEAWPVATEVSVREPAPAPAPPVAHVAAPPVQRRAVRVVTKHEPEPTVPPAWPGESEFRDGWSAYQRGDYGQAAQWLATSCHVATGDVAEDACFWYAVSLERTARHDDAIAAYRNFLERWPAKRRSDEARRQLAALLHR